jgi:hypothetical protein
MDLTTNNGSCKGVELSVGGRRYVKSRIGDLEMNSTKYLIPIQRNT